MNMFVIALLGLAVAASPNWSHHNRLLQQARQEARHKRRKP